MASDALVRAVKIEKSIGYPMVALADNIEVPMELWVPRFRDGPLAAPLLHFRDRNIVNPFGRYWFASAKTRLLMMRADSPSHADKYDWLLALHDAIGNQHDLIPLSVINKLLELGIIEPRTSTASIGESAAIERPED